VVELCDAFSEAAALLSTHPTVGGARPPAQRA